MPNTPEISKIARHFLKTNSVGVLATHSLDVEGYPFGSITPYFVNGKGFPSILISNLAQHTRNIQANKKVSLTIFDLQAQDVQNSTRLTWIGDAEVLPRDKQLQEIYLRYFPSAKTQIDLPDFHFYQITLKRARYIGGFGQIAWVEPSDLVLENPLQDAQTDIVEHMNQDHPSTIIDYCRGLRNITPRQVSMLGIDSEGFDILADNKRLRFAFDSPVLTPEDARTALVTLARKSRTNMPTVGFEQLPEKSKQ